MADQLKDVITYQRHLFSCLDEFFVRLTGTNAIDFSTIKAFTDTIHANARSIADRASTAYPWLEVELRKLYSQRGVDAFRAAKTLGGLRLVQGGGSRFLGSQLNSVRSTLLFADTVLIPDPVAPWIERDRTEEKFRHVNLMQAIHALLHLKPLVEADLPFPPILVFPSWEKLLEDKDAVTQGGIVQLVTDVLARFIDSGIATFDDAREFAIKHPDQFVEAIERNHLIVAPGGNVGLDVKETLAAYEVEVARWRSDEDLQMFQQLPMQGKVFQIIFERIAPQFHLLENSESLGAQPLLSIEQQAHYFGLVSETNRGRLEKLGLLSDKTSAMVKGLSSERLGWLSQVPIDALVELRSNNENISFRGRLENAIARLHESALGDVDRVAAEISLEIDRAIIDHSRTIAQIDSKYSQTNLKTAAAGVGAVACMLVPSLAPFVGPALPFAVAAKFGWDAWDKYTEKQKQARSLVGILATTKQSQS